MKEDRYRRREYAKSLIDQNEAKQADANTKDGEEKKAGEEKKEEEKKDAENKVQQDHAGQESKQTRAETEEQQELNGGLKPPPQQNRVIKEYPVNYETMDNARVLRILNANPHLQITISHKKAGELNLLKEQIAQELQGNTQKPVEENANAEQEANVGQNQGAEKQVQEIEMQHEDEVPVHPNSDGQKPAIDGDLFNSGQTKGKENPNGNEGDQQELQKQIQQEGNDLVNSDDETQGGEGED